MAMERPLATRTLTPEKTPLALQVLFDHKNVKDILINGPQNIFWDHGFGLAPAPKGCFFQSETHLKNWVLFELSQVGKTWDAKHPFVDATLKNHFRIHVVFPPISSDTLFISLRKLPTASGYNADHASRWEPQKELFSFLKKQVLQGDSMLISGATGSGKTTLLNDLVHSIPKKDRILALEDTPELTPSHPHFIRLLSRPPNADGFGEITLRDLLKQALRMRPDRILIGECRGAEVLEWLQLLNTGHRGAMATVHANSSRDAIRRIVLLALLASGGWLKESFIKELFAHGVKWLVHVQKNTRAHLISSIDQVVGLERDTIILRPMLNEKAYATDLHCPESSPYHCSPLKPHK